MNRRACAVAIGLALVVPAAVEAADGTPEQLALIPAALARADAVVRSTVFGEIFRALNPRATASGCSPAPVLESFEKRGQFAKENISFYRPWWWPWSASWANTTACEEQTTLNRRKHWRDAIDMANTLVHERVHSFGYEHVDNDPCDDGDACDAAYVAGDLAEALLRHEQGQPMKFEECYCEDLKTELEKRKIEVQVADGVPGTKRDANAKPAGERAPESPG